MKTALHVEDAPLGRAQLELRNERVPCLNDAALVLSHGPSRRSSPQLFYVYSVASRVADDRCAATMVCNHPFDKQARAHLLTDL